MPCWDDADRDRMLHRGTPQSSTVQRHGERTTLQFTVCKDGKFTFRLYTDLGDLQPAVARAYGINLWCQCIGMPCAVFPDPDRWEPKEHDDVYELIEAGIACLKGSEVDEKQMWLVAHMSVEDKIAGTTDQFPASLLAEAGWRLENKKRQLFVKDMDSDEYDHLMDAQHNMILNDASYLGHMPYLNATAPPEPPGAAFQRFLARNGLPEDYEVIEDFIKKAFHCDRCSGAGICPYLWNCPRLCGSAEDVMDRLVTYYTIYGVELWDREAGRMLSATIPHSALA